MNEDEARRVLRSAYPVPDTGKMAWRRWIEGPATPRRPRRVLMTAVLAALVAVVIAVPLGVTVALHQSPRGAKPASVASPGVTCAIANGVTSAEFDRVSPTKQYFPFPASVRITNPNRIANLTSALCALQRQVPGVYHCPSVANPLGYRARLFDGSGVTLDVTIFADACPLVYGLGGTGARLVNDEQTWRVIGLALGIANANLQTFTGG